MKNNFKIEDGYKYLLTLQGEGAWETSNSNITDGEMTIHHQGGSASELHLSDNESYLMYTASSPGFVVAIVMISEDRIYICVMPKVLQLVLLAVEEHIIQLLLKNSNSIKI